MVTTDHSRLDLPAITRAKANACALRLLLA
jgi:hypothetical protein